eukprot:CAMPEP_0194738094 /NCGR_PEP_ID=MMETSP0296-20130528/83691_1 /TAXON_ID=39354 /ORGANISM="Heterosigma akashiwo, Strain CCMP2393" /LENGTH=134 /DNA_ID=CAMNT_0039648307 /DNA_START=188 /DNA_END=593 /DNA_ORIENTATION=+
MSEPWAGWGAMEQAHLHAGGLPGHGRPVAPVPRVHPAAQHGDEEQAAVHHQRVQEDHGQALQVDAPQEEPVVIVPQQQQVQGQQPDQGHPGEHQQHRGEDHHPLPEGQPELGDDAAHGQPHVDVLGLGHRRVNK